MKDYLYAVAFIAMFVSLFVFAIIKGTSKEQWYSDKHDSQCEKTLYNNNDCKCYNRFMKK